MNPITINPISINDLTQLQKISRQTFVETFADSNAKENIDKYLADCLSIEQLTKEFSDENSKFYMAYEESKAVGYFKINFDSAQTEIKDKNSLEIERIYILKEYLGRSLGQLLLNNILDIAKSKKLSFVWLGVWENNFRAINFYKKNGFIEFDKHIFNVGDDPQTDIMMKLELKF